MHLLGLEYHFCTITLGLGSELGAQIINVDVRVLGDNDSQLTVGGNEREKGLKPTLNIGSEVIDLQALSTSTFLSF